MKKWISVTVTCYEEFPESNNCHFFYDDDEAELHLNQILSYADGMKALRQAEKLLGRTAELIVNRFTPTVSYKEIHGYFDRE